jgi:hypothetical protein
MRRGQGVWMVYHVQAEGVVKNGGKGCFSLLLRAMLVSSRQTL